MLSNREIKEKEQTPKKRPLMINVRENYSTHALNK